MALFNSGSAGATRPNPSSQEGGPMGLKEYSTVINGQATTLQLSDEDAKLQGFTKKDLVSNQTVELTEAQREAANEDAARAEAEAKANADKEAEEQRVAEEEKVKAEAEAKAKAAANKQASAPQNKGAAPQAPKA